MFYYYADSMSGGTNVPPVLFSFANVLAESNLIIAFCSSLNHFNISSQISFLMYNKVSDFLSYNCSAALFESLFLFLSELSPWEFG